MHLVSRFSLLSFLVLFFLSFGGLPVLATDKDAKKAKSSRPVIFDRGSDPVLTPVYRRDSLRSGVSIVGPAIVEERETTSVIRPSWSVEVIDDGSLVATKGT